MNYLQEAETELKRYIDLNNSLDVIKNDLNVIKYDLSTVKAANYDAITGGGCVNGDDRIANMLFKKDHQERAYRSTYNKIKNIERALDNVERDGEKKTKHKELLKLYYIDKVGDERTMEQLDISRTHFYRVKRMALSRFATQFYGINVN